MSNKMATMKQDRLYRLIDTNLLTEKSTRLSENNQFVFRVKLDSTKQEIKVALETIFKITVKSVQTVSVKGKKKRSGKVTYHRKSWKKAYVKLGDGMQIDFSNIG